MAWKHVHTHVWIQIEKMKEKIHAVFVEINEKYKDICLYKDHFKNNGKRMKKNSNIQL